MDEGESRTEISLAIDAKNTNKIKKIPTDVITDCVGCEGIVI